MDYVSKELQNILKVLDSDRSFNSMKKWTMWASLDIPSTKPRPQDIIVLVQNGADNRQAYIVLNILLDLVIKR